MHSAGRCRLLARRLALPVRLRRWIELGLLAVLVAASAAPATPPAPAKVTFLADSVGGVLWWYAPAQQELGRGLNLELEVRTCMRLVRSGCIYEGTRPPSALESLERLGRDVGEVLVVDVGYNDFPSTYADGIDQVMSTATANGVRQVVWVTLSEVRKPYPELNAMIERAVDRWPQLVVAHWDAESRGRQWFSDDVHLTAQGGVALARFLRPFVLDGCGEPCRPSDEGPGADPVLRRARDGSLQVTLAAASATGGQAVAGRVTLGRPAPQGGLRCSVSVTPSVSSPRTVTIGQGRRRASFSLTTSGVDRRQTITTTVGCGSSSVRIPLIVDIPRLRTIDVARTVLAGSHATLRVGLTGPAGPHGLAVRLVAGSAAVAAPPVVVVPPGAREVNVTLVVEPVGWPLESAIEATAPGADLVARFRVEP